MKAIAAVMTAPEAGRTRERPLYVGTSKPNVGHSEAASGSTGLIKTVLALEKGMLPPQILLETTKPGLDLDGRNIKLAHSLMPWPNTGGNNTTRKAIVNSFGSGGTNAMVALEYPHQPADGALGVTVHNHLVQNQELSLSRLFPLSARSKHSLLEWAQDLKTYLQHKSASSAPPSLDQLSHTLANHRSHFPWRVGIVASTIESLMAQLDSLDSEDATSKHTKGPGGTQADILVFNGQGSQYFQMGYQALIAAPDSIFSRSLRLSETLFRALGAPWSLVDELSKDEGSSRLNDSRLGQPATTAVQVALVDQLTNGWGIKPAAVVGHSSGEIAAAYAAGALSHEAAIRVAYERSFLAEVSRQRLARADFGPVAGAMMAVGLGEKDVQERIAELGLDGVDMNGVERGKHGAGQVVVACINSPSSTTVSGDAPAVQAFKQALDSTGVFARLLKVDTAYHSHHMEAVGPDYLARLKGLKTASTSKTRFFSSVTETEKCDGFGAEYWVENLVSPVRFSDALTALARDSNAGGITSLNLIEIGPHKALSGAIRQTLNQLKGLSYRYIPTLVRGENSHTCLMQTASELFKFEGGNGSRLDVGAMISLGLPSSPQTKLHDLPPYHWDHTTNLWSESRLSKEYRFRRHAHHDLLGLRTPLSPDNEPSWRLILTLDTLPWLKDHVVDGFVVFPASGYLAMAIEAVKQLHQDQDENQRTTTRISGYHLKDVSFVRSLTLSEDTEKDGVEILLTLHRLRNRSGYNFTVYSVSEDKGWQEHCNGHIASSLADAALNEVDQGRQVELSRKAQVESLARNRKSCRQSIQASAMYVQLASAGNHYGSSFAAVTDVRLGALSRSNGKNAGLTTSTSLSKVVLPDIAATMPARFAQPHVIHPASLDALLHTCLVLFQLTPEYSRSGKGSVMPLFFGNVHISADVVNVPGQQLQVASNLRTASANSAIFDVVAFQGAELQENPVITISNGEMRVIGGSYTQTDDETQGGDSNIFRSEWGMDISSVTAASLESVEIPLQSTQAGMQPHEKTAALDLACIRWIDWSLTELQQTQLTVKDDYRISLLSWMKSLFDSPSSPGHRALSASAPRSRDQVLDDLANLGVEGELVARMGPQLTSVLSGQTDPLSLFLGNDLLYRVYNADDTLRGNRYLAEYVRHLAFQRRGAGLRIIEIGAGTAGATLQLLRACSPNGEEFCDEYVFTDISPGFFETAREVTLQQWASMITFKTLDLERDAVEQGFDEHGYDLVLASNVVHATADLGRSLGHIHRLLKPGGVLGMVELVELTPFHNMTFGMLPGWWAGVDDGRTRGPLQSAQQWHERLRHANFSGVDLVAYDFPLPARHCAFITSTAESTPTCIDTRRDSVMGLGAGRIEILHALPAGQSDTARLELFCGKLEKDLVNRAGFQAGRRQWSDQTVDEACAYVIIDWAQRPLLAHASPAQLEHITSLLTKCLKVYWITISTSAAGDHQVAISPEHGMAVGLSRSARSENDSLMFFTLDVQDPVSVDILRSTSDFITSSEKKIANGQTDGLEFEYLLRHGELRIQRLVTHENLSRTLRSSDKQQQDDHTDLEECRFYQPDKRLKIQVERPGILSSLTFVQEDGSFAMDLEADQIQLEAHAWGVNFHDLYVALGQMKGTASNPVVTMGGECAGVVTRVGSAFTARFKPGDRVAVLTGTDAPYGSSTRVDGHLVHAIPDSMSFTEAASIPVAFGTAYYSLVDCARLQPGQTVLIHAAAGGLGQAAIVLAQHIGAVIFASVGSDAKRRVLLELYGIPESHIFNSRTTDFAAGVMRLTGGRGVDVVLNSTSGEIADASWRCIAELGTFLEVGKTDIYARSSLSMEPFDRNARFVAVDLKAVSRAHPKMVQELLERVFALFQPNSSHGQSHFSPLPTTTIPIGDLEQAFRLMASRKHTGKLVLEATDDSTVKARKPTHTGRGSTRLRGDRTYIIAGGLGNLGKRLCRHLQDCGARHIALLSRKLLNEDEHTALQVELAEHRDSVVRVFACDIADPSQVAQIHRYLAASWAPVAGVIQAAMVLSDRTLSQMTMDHFRSALQPKYHGTRNLVEAFAGLSDNIPSLDFFVMLSSVASVLGLRGQSNYAAGNGYQDMLAQQYAAHNLVAINLPLIRETAITLPAESRGLVVRQGAQVVDMDAVLAVVDYAISGAAQADGCAQITYGVSGASMRERAGNGLRVHPLLRHVFAQGMARAVAVDQQEGSRASVEVMIARASDAAEVEALVLEALRDKVAALTAVEPGELGVDAPIAELGLDSLVSIELKNYVAKILRAAVVTADIMDSPCLRAFAALVSQRSALVVRAGDKAHDMDKFNAGVDASGWSHNGYL